MPNSAEPASDMLERDVKEAMVKVCEAEQRTKLLTTLLRMGLLSRDVKHFVGKQLDQQRSKGQSKGWGKQTKVKSGTQRMVEKLADNRRDEAKLRKERDTLRKEFEEMVPKYVYNRVMKKLKCRGLDWR